MDAPRMKPIWYFVGLLLAIMGAVILAAGLYELAVPPQHLPHLAGFHANVWWGALMIAVGLVFVLTTRKRTIE